MAFKRVIAAPALSGEQLTRAMVGIGMLFGGAPTQSEPNIEDTLLAASTEGMDRQDLRVLAVLTTWLDVHLARVNADRLRRAVSASNSVRVRAYWSAVAHWKRRDARLKRLSELYAGPRIDVLVSGAEFLLRRQGEDERFAKGPLRVPAGTLRDRPSDVLLPQELATSHRGYYWRVVIGPTYRADMWAALEADPDLSAAALARRAYGSFGTAWEVRQDWSVVMAPPATG